MKNSKNKAFLDILGGGCDWLAKNTLAFLVHHFIDLLFIEAYIYVREMRMNNKKHMFMSCYYYISPSQRQPL
jgi:hypothetical protein